MILYITDAKYLYGYRLWLKFSDGSESVVDLARKLWGAWFVTNPARIIKHNSVRVSSINPGNIMKLSENIKPISYLKANAVEVIENLKAGHQPMVITQNGEAVLVIQSVADYEQTWETLAMLKFLAQSQQAVSYGKTVSSAEAFAQLRQRRSLK